MVRRLRPSSMTSHAAHRRFLLAVPIAVLISNAPVTVPIAVPMFSAPAFAESDDERRARQKKEDEERAAEQARQRKLDEERAYQMKQEQAARDATRVDEQRAYQKKLDEQKAEISSPHGTYMEIVSTREERKQDARCVPKHAYGLFQVQTRKYTTYNNGRPSTREETVETFIRCVDI